MENMVKEAALRYNWVSPQDYLADERVAEEKHEYFDGEVVVMQGASIAHEDIVSNLVREIGNALKGGKCRIRASNLRLSLSFRKTYTYPDATIVCGEVHFTDDYLDTIQNPKVIFEVVSRSSERIDYGDKWIRYQRIASLDEYVLINSFDKVEVNVFRRTDESWTYVSYTELNEPLVLESVGVRILLSEIYENVFFGQIED